MTALEARKSCLNCRWTELRFDPDGGAYLWCSKRTKGLNLPDLFGPVCADYRPAGKERKGQERGS